MFDGDGVVGGDDGGLDDDCVPALIYCSALELLRVRHVQQKEKVHVHRVGQARLQFHHVVGQ